MNDSPGLVAIICLAMIVMIVALVGAGIWR
jgi:hypothetical protein